MAAVLLVVVCAIKSAAASEPRRCGAAHEHIILEQMEFENFWKSLTLIKRRLTKAHDLAHQMK
jgi:hypothetical protein